MNKAVGHAMGVYEVTTPELPTAALAKAGDAIVTFNTQGQISSWNSATEALLGCRADSAVGQTLALIMPADYRPRRIAALHAAMDHGVLVCGGCPTRVEAMAADGQVIPLAM